MSTNKKSEHSDNPPPYSPPRPDPSRVYVNQNQGQPVQHTIPHVFTFGPNPVDVICPSCAAVIRTTIKTEPSSKTHLMAIVLLLLCWPFACVPYCVDSCQNANHYCPNCDTYIGTYQS